MSNENTQSQNTAAVSRPSAQNGNGHQTAIRPRANIVETADGFTLEVELPGVRKDALEVTFENGQLTVAGRRTPLPAGAELLYRESRPMDFRRVFELDPSLDTAHIAARLEHGVLTLHLPKAEAAKPRRIEVNSLN